MSADETKKLYTSLNSLPYNETDDLLNANGTSGGGMKETVYITKDAPVVPIDYAKYAMIGVLALLVGYVAYKKFNTPK